MAVWRELPIWEEEVLLRFLRGVRGIFYILWDNSAIEGADQ